MKIKQDPITKLWVREDGAVLLPPSGTKFKTFRWTFGAKGTKGYRKVGYKGKYYLVHQLVCRAFHGLPPMDKPQVDHINRTKDDNRPSNLHWVDNKENADNTNRVDKAFEKYGVRSCEDSKAYGRAYAAKRATKKQSQGLSYRKGPDGKFGWYPRIRP